ncbi:hypothetical protein BASA50_002165 [Batrachochytrium salamandrivorans]|uniref:Uncharacterized protein n=1 Tax=Batrachochytrium salamandrivorans TaxID=1357716 RepID=A0ABQ8FM23_9FUNG|nr:hypothetical protein BASA62_007916 [Batrachochytrium salamandrivorans]KAH6571645.1 hypothetical protein BASA60_007041 [Batrachochytrium salamandrivorans]KAH6600600.1 hypothetical protein BASA50_002165 [Batrachochytrium salamandrivorans]
MQFFYLFSFVVAASYAVALPQPAEISEKYSSNVDANLASGLEARSYQPVLNSQKDSATLTLLKRQDDSEESPSPDTTPVETDDSYPFNDDNTSSENLASTISKVGDGNASLFKEGDSIAKKIGGDVGDLVARYIRREIYVNVALKAWLSSSLNNVLSTIKSGLGDDQYSKIEPGLVAKLDELKITFNALLNAAIHTTTKILTDDSSVIENVKNLSTSFYSASSACTEIFSELKVQLLRFEGSSTLVLDLTEASQSVSWFNIGQIREHDGMMEALKAAHPQ